MSAYLSRPKVSHRVPGILFIYEVFGMNEEMTRIADELAVEGYAVMLPDLFDRGPWFSCVRQVMKDMRAGSGRGVEDLIQARNWLAQRDYVDSKRIAVLGLCMGGGFALLLGKTGLFQVSAPFYGQAPQQLNGLCPVVASYGGRDKMLLKDAQRLQEVLPTLGIPYDMRVYPEAGHSFMNRPSNWFVRLLGGAMGAGYRPEDAADAKRRVLEFLQSHL
ncbi:MAG TPA: dienelactone hydrolase family protein [Bryobacteraceae bacterium]|nr:dienelactone hydrolase family protein [Bryobacteraceae bacterium]